MRGNLYLIFPKDLFKTCEFGGPQDHWTLLQWFSQVLTWVCKEKCKWVRPWVHTNRAENHGFGPFWACFGGFGHGFGLFRAYLRGCGHGIWAFLAYLGHFGPISGFWAWFGSFWAYFRRSGHRFGPFFAYFWGYGHGFGSFWAYFRRSGHQFGPFLPIFGVMDMDLSHFTRALLGVLGMHFKHSGSRAYLRGTTSWSWSILDHFGPILGVLAMDLGHSWPIYRDLGTDLDHSCSKAHLPGIASFIRYRFSIILL